MKTTYRIFAVLLMAIAAIVGAHHVPSPPTVSAEAGAPHFASQYQYVQPPGDAGTVPISAGPGVPAPWGNVGVNGGALLVPTDSNDILVWRLNDPVDSGTVANTGTAGASGNLTVDTAGTTCAGSLPCINFGAPTRFGSAVKLEHGEQGAGVRPRIYGANGIPDAGATAMTVSAWVLFPPFGDNGVNGFNTGENFNIVTKGYHPYGATWASPFHTIGLYGLSPPSFSGNVVVGPNGGGTYYFPAIIQNQAAYLQLGQWHHIGVTWDVATELVSQYMNGRLLGTASTADAGAIDFNTADGGPWIMGCPGPNPQPGNPECANEILYDVRVATVARPLSWFQAVYAAGNQATPAP